MASAYLQPAVAGFALTDCYDLFYPDALHQSALGDMERINSAIKDNLTDQQLAEVNRQLKRIGTYPSTHCFLAVQLSAAPTMPAASMPAFLQILAPR